MALIETYSEPLGGGKLWCEMLLIDLSPGRSDWVGWSGDWFHDGWYRLGCELLVLYGLIPLGDAGVVTCGTEKGSDREVGIKGNGKIIPEVTRIVQGRGWCSRGILLPSIPKTVNSAKFERQEPAAAIAFQLALYLVLGEGVVRKGGGRSNDIGGRAGRAGGREDDDRHVPSGRDGRSSVLNVLFS